MLLFREWTLICDGKGRDTGSATNIDKIQKVIDNFEILITGYEKEISGLLVEVEKNLKHEQGRKKY